MAVTPNYNFKLIDFDSIPWHEDEHDNWRIVDSVFSNFIVVTNLKGVWQNATAVAVAEKYVDPDLGTIWEVDTAHTTPSTGTFAADRTANAGRWSAFTVQVTSRGAYAQSTVYSPNDFVVDGGRYGVCQAAFTSDSDAATTALSYDADVTAGNIATLLDVSNVIAATHDTNTVAAGGTPTATYNASTTKFDFGLVTGATGDTGPTGESGASNIVLDTTPQLGGFLDTNDKFVSFSQGAAIASVAGDTDIWSAFDGNTVHITGTNAITDFGTPKQAGDHMWVIFDAAASVVDSATITCAGNTNFQAAANDLALVYALSTSTFLFIPFKNDGTPVVTSVVADTSPQLGGFLDANGNYIQTEKGGDLTSASPLVIDTDGDYFDVTGTTGFSAMTVAADRQFTLQFDGVLTMTHHSTNLDLPGAANITTAAGDVGIFQSTGANTVQCIAYTKADGTAVVSAGGISPGTEQATTSGTTKDFTGIASGTKRITINFAGVSTDGTAALLVQIGDSGGFETSAYTGGGYSPGGGYSASTSGFKFGTTLAAGDLVHGTMILTLEDASNFTWVSSGVGTQTTTSGGMGSGGAKSLSAELTQIRVTTVGTPDDFDAGAVNITTE